jgi:hypothetical protein
MREVEVPEFVGVETARFAGRGGNGGFGGKEDGMRGGRGIEEVCDGRVNVGYEIDGVDVIAGTNGKSEMLASAVLRVDGLSRS